MSTIIRGNLDCEEASRGWKLTITVPPSVKRRVMKMLDAHPSGLKVDIAILEEAK